MKLLLLTLSMNQGGAETHVAALAKALTERGHEVTLVSSGGMLVRSLQKKGVKHVTVPWDRRSFGAWIASFGRLSKLIKAHDWDLIHAHGRIPAFFGYSLARKYDLPLVTTIHARFSHHPVRRAMTRFGRENIAVGEDLKQDTCEQYFLDSDCVWVIPNGIDTAKFSPSPKKKSGQAARVAFVSRLDSDCSLGADLLLELAGELKEKIPNLEILLAGGGEELPRLEKKAKKLNDRLHSQTVRLTGYLSDPTPLLQSADVVLGVSRAALEAMACGTPVILGGNEGFLGICTPHVWQEAESTNFCCRETPSMTKDRLREALLTLLECSPEQRAQLGELGRNYVCDHHSLSHMTDKTEALYQNSIKIHQGVAKKTSSKHILLCGYYGYGNLGDEALLKETVKRVKRDYPQLPPVALTKNGRRDEHRYGISCVGRKHPLHLIKTIRKAERLIFGGGTLLQDATSLRSLLYYSAVLQIANRNHIPVELWGNGLGAPHSRWAEKILKSDLKICERVELRDKTSEQIANKLLPNCERIYRVKDLAADVSPADPKRIQYLLRHFHLTKTSAEKSVKPFVIAVPKGRRPDPKMVYQLKKQKQKGTEILLLPMYPREDMPACRRLQKKTGCLVAKGFSASDIVGIAAHAEGVYAMRLHALIFAKQAGIPFFGFGNDPKIQSFCKENPFYKK